MAHALYTNATLVVARNVAERNFLQALGFVEISQDELQQKRENEEILSTYNSFDDFLAHQYTLVEVGNLGWKINEYDTLVYVDRKGFLGKFRHRGVTVRATLREAMKEYPVGGTIGQSHYPVTVFEYNGREFVFEDACPIEVGDYNERTLQAVTAFVDQFKF